MEGLRATRVIVVDDEPKDGHAMVLTLAEKGIPSAYFKDSDDAPPQEERLTGVRLAFLDMDVIGASTDKKNMMSALVNLVRTILSPENGPYIVVAWTGHPDYVTDFMNYLFSIPDVPKPVEIVRITKSEYKVYKSEDREDDYKFDLSGIAAEVEKVMPSLGPLRFLQVWEEQCFKAANAVATELSKLAASDNTDPQQWRADWKAQMLRLIHTMAQAVAGQKNLVDGESVVTSFFSSLNPLHADRLENRTSDICAMLADCSSEVLQPENRQESDLATRAKINTMLHLAFERLDKFYAGNVYSCHQGAPLSSLIPNVDALIESFLKGKPPSPEEPDENKKKEWSEKKKNIADCAIPIVVETNTLCDHSQNNIKLARLIAGLLVPEAQLRQLKDKAEWMWKFGPVSISTEDERSSEYYLLLNSLFLISGDLTNLRQAHAMMRLRGQAFAVLQGWFGSHSARPGMLLLT